MSNRSTQIDRTNLATLLERERKTYRDNHQKSLELYKDAKNLFGGVPMPWMNKWVGGFPLYMQAAKGNIITDVDGNEYIDFALGDTAAMTGHSPDASVKAIIDRIQDLGGITTMMPTEDAQWVGAELSRRFGVPLWSFTVSATDANRWAIRLARLATGKSKILVFSYCYHGSVDEAFGVLDENGNTVIRPGNVAPPVPIDQTTRVVEFNDLPAMEAALAHGDVAAILMEPAMTNIGIVLPEDGYLVGVQDLAKKYGALLIIDETHTISVGFGGMTADLGLKPDFFTIGKAIAGGVPVGTFGMTHAVADAIKAKVQLEIIDTGGIGSTLAGNALSLAAMRMSHLINLSKKRLKMNCQLMHNILNEKR